MSIRRVSAANEPAGTQVGAAGAKPSSRSVIPVFSTFSNPGTTDGQRASLVEPAAVLKSCGTAPAAPTKAGAAGPLTAAITGLGLAAATSRALSEAAAAGLAARSSGPACRFSLSPRVSDPGTTNGRAAAVIELAAALKPSRSAVAGPARPTAAGPVAAAINGLGLAVATARASSEAVAAGLATRGAGLACSSCWRALRSFVVRSRLTCPGLRYKSIAEDASEFSPRPRTWPSSWVTTVWKSYWFCAIPLASEPKYQFQPLIRVIWPGVYAPMTPWFTPPIAPVEANEICTCGAGIGSGDLHQAEAQRGNLRIEFGHGVGDGSLHRRGLLALGQVDRERDRTGWQGAGCGEQLGQPPPAPLFEPAASWGAGGGPGGGGGGGGGVQAQALAGER